MKKDWQAETKPVAKASRCTRHQPCGFPPDHPTSASLKGRTQLPLTNTVSVTFLQCPLHAFTLRRLWCPRMSLYAELTLSNPLVATVSLPAEET